MLSQGELYSHDGPRPLLQYSVNNHTAIWGNINPESDCFHHKFRLDIEESKPLLLKIRLRPKSQLITLPLQNSFPPLSPFKEKPISCLSLPQGERQFSSPVCLSLRPPPPYQKAGCPCNVSGRASSGNLDWCWHSAARRLLCSRRQIPCHTGDGGGGKWNEHRKNEEPYSNGPHDCRQSQISYLIEVFTVCTITAETCRTGTTLPRSIWWAVAIHSPKARVRQTAICKRFTG